MIVVKKDTITTTYISRFTTTIRRKYTDIICNVEPSICLIYIICHSSSCHGTKGRDRKEINQPRWINRYMENLKAWSVTCNSSKSLFQSNSSECNSSEKLEEKKLISHYVPISTVNYGSSKTYFIISLGSYTVMKINHVYYLSVNYSFLYNVNVHFHYDDFLYLR